jgi:hypothetical protein
MPTITCRTYASRRDADGRVWCSTCRSYVAYITTADGGTDVACPFVVQPPQQPNDVA